MIGRIVVLDTGWQTVSVVQDLLEILLGSGQAGFLLNVTIMQSSEEAATEAEELQVHIKRSSGSYTSGSGGGAATVVKYQTGDAAHGLAGIERNNTTQASAGTGALDTIDPGSFNVLAGEWGRVFTPEERIPIGPSQAFLVSLDESPADAITMRCTAKFMITHG